jgi:hypothetical protein
VERKSGLAAALTLLTLASCVGARTPPAAPLPPRYIADGSTRACSVSYDGFVWYRVGPGSFSPIEVRESACPEALLRITDPPRPSWAVPNGPTQARFVAASLQEKYLPAGMRSIEAAAAPHHIPVTWMLGNSNYMGLADTYNAYHANNGDGMEAEYVPWFLDALRAKFPWYVPTVSVAGAVTERDITGYLEHGEHAFWGIAWNSTGTDHYADYGAPWGTYCADPQSYKRPAPDGSCSLLAFEWTARDLTRAYLSGHEEWFSVDPDDLLLRARFTRRDAQRYVRAIVDAYAAAGQTQPLVMVAQQETAENLNPGDAQILEALYGEARSDGMRAETLAQAAGDARAFSSAPRAVAFPFLTGGVRPPSSLLHGDTLYPATIDYHDTQSGMTFLAGHTLPTRIFRYADARSSSAPLALRALPVAQMPVVTGASFERGTLTVHVTAPVALHAALALWSDPRILRITQPGALAAGRAGVVIPVDLKRGGNAIAIACPGCTGTTLPYST